MGGTIKTAQSLYDTSALTRLDDLSGYRRWFMDKDLWRPYVRLVCQRHRLLPCGSIRPGLAGTCPTFVVDERWVIKFFGRLFEGEVSFEVERKCAQLLAKKPILPVPKLVGTGDLQEDPNAGWTWPYLIFAHLPGISLGEVYHQVPFTEKLTLARMLGEGTRRLHSLPLPADVIACLGTCDDLLRRQRSGCTERHRAWGSLPDHLLAEVEIFLQSTDEIPVRIEQPGLIHADLTRDHILGRLENGNWQTLGIIDFGDAMIGHLPYELVALHLDLFACDKRLLKVYLDAYALDGEVRQQLPRIAMRMALLHQFNVWEGLFDRMLPARQASSMEELCLFLWDVATLM